MAMTAKNANMPFRFRIVSPRVVLRVLAFFTLSFVFTGTAWLLYQTPRRQAPIAMPHDFKAPQAKAHPIDYLMKKADATLSILMTKETKDIAAAADAYRRRRGRHPPPGFAEWFQFASDHDALIIESFFDQIYHDLTPFWGLEAKRIRRLAKHFPTTISVRDGNARKTTDHEQEWMDIWHNMTATIQKWLPDVDIPINIMNESRVVVPWENISEYVQTERASRELLPRSKVLNRLSSLSSLDADPDEAIETNFTASNAYWDTARVGCAPDSPAGNVSAARDFSGPPPIPSGLPRHSFEGYVQNWTAIKDPCQHPSLRESHGTFVEPVSVSTTNSLFPMFGGSKLPMNNDILIPPAIYWSDDPQFTIVDQGKPWEKRTNQMLWRGNASGGRNRDSNWTRFHRHRFVAMTNGTAVQVAERNPNGAGRGKNFILQSYKTYHLAATQYMDLGTWLNRIADVGFTNLECYPGTGSPLCPYTDDYFKITKQMSLEGQFGYKFLPDVDENSFSGRYRSLLASSSLPIKATIYSEWHDSRLIPWVHFVPMDNSFVDIYGILDYFVGTGVDFKANDGQVVTVGAHDESAKKIAMAGKEWAEKVLRKEDMLIYLFRLLIEYARICDDDREKLGFVDDLKE